MARKLLAVVLVAFTSAGYAGAATATFRVRVVVEGMEPKAKDDEKKAKPRTVSVVLQKSQVGRLALFRVTTAPLPPGVDLALPDVEVQMVAVRGKDGYRFGARVAVPGSPDRDTPLTFKPAKAGEAIRLALDPFGRFFAEVSAHIEPGLVERQPNLVPALLKVLGRGEPETEKPAFNALVALGADAVPALLDGVKGDNKLIQFHALRVLQAIAQNDYLPAEEVLPPVIKLVNGTDRDLRAVALNLLTELGRRDRRVARELVPTFVRLLEDPDELIRRHAAVTLEMIIQKGE
jgi:hypothetical protein